MDHTTHNKIVSFIWSVADDVLRDVYVRGKYRDVILPMTVLRRLDALLEPTKEAVLEQKAMLDKAEIVGSGVDAALCAAAEQRFYNTSPFTLSSLLSSPKQLRVDFANYLDGYSPNVQTIIEKFNFRDQLRKLESADVLGDMIEKFLDKNINLSPKPVPNADGSVRLPGLTNLGMGYVFEELIRRFNEENNEEAGEHFTPREIVRLMTKLVFTPVKDEIKSTSYLVYDCACGTGGMLTEADAMLSELAQEQSKDVVIHLYGQEVNDETYAICKADLLIKGEEEQNIAYGSTLSADAFPSMEFDFMLANPPYGKSWKTDLERIAGGNKKDVSDHRFVVQHDGNPELQLVSSSSDGQLMFLVNMLSKMKASGSRVATVHNGSALFSGDAGQGESNIRQWILENDYLEAIIGLPLNMFYNTPIATYIWVLTNKKPEHREGRVQLVDATEIYTKLRRNMGQKNCELTAAQVDEIVQTFLDFQDEGTSKLFDNEDFGYWKVTVERPLRLQTQATAERIEVLKEMQPKLKVLADVARELFGDDIYDDYNVVESSLKAHLKAKKIRTSASDLKKLRDAISERDEVAKPIIKHQDAHGAVEYEPDPALRDTENVPLKESVEAYFEREVRPHVPDAWIDHQKTVKGYKVSFAKYFYKYQPLRSLEEIKADILRLEAETDGVLREIVGV